ncbi:MAG: nicotinate phosphoribosyltransferase [Myxococcales bacterium]|nr:nicotinate phosphoribosyltransferase [Myxococcales bacterium]
MTTPAGPSILTSDGYKFSMAEAGYPLRTETFYLSHRRGGPQVVPFDAHALVARLLPSVEQGDYAYLAEHGYDMGAGFKAAIVAREALTVRALPQGAWFLPREPWLTITGPSALVSWLEPLLLQASFRVQVATLALTSLASLASPDALARELGVLTCEAERDLVGETLDAVGVAAPKLTVDEAAYAERVAGRVRDLVRITDGRFFEVGLRAATCVAQHRVALRAAKEAGLRRTSHALLARELGLEPVGTMGHEHVQRFGTDEDAFRAMRDRRPGRSSFLLDTFDTLRSGLPAALRVMAEAPDAGDSVRYDSGDKEAQYREVVRLGRELGLRPVHILEDSFDLPLTQRFEDLRRELGVPADTQFYGYGGFLVAQTTNRALTRDRVAAVYKLSQSGPTPNMKFGDEAGAGKESVPGRPLVARRVRGEGPVGLIVQEGEPLPDGYVAGAALGPAELTLARDIEGASLAQSEATKALVASCRRARERVITGAGRLAPS